MDNALDSGAAILREPVRIRIPGDKQRLKKEHARHPHTRPASKPGQEVLAH